MLILGHKATHSFYTPEPKYARAFDDVPVQYPESAFPLDDKPAWIKQRLATWHGIYGPLFDWRKKFPDDRPEAVKDFAAMVHAYWATLLSVDDSVGRLRQWLDETGSARQHGRRLRGRQRPARRRARHGRQADDARAEHPDSAGGALPGADEAGKVIDQQVLTIDLAPSLLELSGAPALKNIHGRSWVSS